MSDETMDAELEEIRRRKFEELLNRQKNTTSNSDEDTGDLSSSQSNKNNEINTTPVHLDSGSFDQFIKEKPAVFVDFWADWCNPCKMVAPILDELAQEFAGKVWIGKVDVDNNQQLARRFGATSIPTFWAFKNGRQVKRFVGVQPKSVFKQIFNRLLNSEQEDLTTTTIRRV